jgi:hypothetical protein
MTVAGCLLGCVLFAYPEVRCDSNSCVIPANTFNVTAPLPPLPAAKDDAEDD